MTLWQRSMMDFALTLFFVAVAVIGHEVPVPVVDQDGQVRQ
jgi:hypothetical protein